ncbi:MAG: hypothetical protein QM764_24700 [Chitinophagaceae bacterium]
MDYFLFAGYLLLFAWIVTKVKFFSNAGLSRSQVIILFLLKVMAGIFYGWVGVYYGQTMVVDTWGYQYLGLQEYKLLQTDPGQYFANFFNGGSKQELFNFLTAKNSFWNEMKFRAVIKLLSIFNIFSFGNYYINVIFYNFLTLFGPVAIYRVMKDVFPVKKVILISGVFFLPSFLFWASGIHKEGLIFTAIGMIVYSMYSITKTHRFKTRYILFTIFGLFIIAILRNFLFVVIVPALIAWLAAAKYPKFSLQVFSLFYLLFIAFFFTAKNIDPRLDLPRIVVAKQREFLDMSGGSMIPVKELKPNGGSFITSLPNAIDFSILRPHPTDVIHLLSLMATVETDLLLIFFALFLFFRKKERYNRPFIYFCLFFSFTTLLSIGYTVNFIGAIVRYRSIILPLLITPMFAKTDFNRISALFKKNAPSK